MKGSYRYWWYVLDSVWLVAAGWVLYQASFPTNFAPGWSPDRFYLISVGVLLLLVALLPYAAVCLTLYFRRRRAESKGRFRFLFVPVAFVVALALMLTDAPLKLRWEASRDDFDKLRSEVALSPRGSILDADVGYYRVTEATAGDGFVAYQVEGFVGEDGLIYHGGFFHSKRGVVDALPGLYSTENLEGHKSLGNGWYVWIIGY